MFFEFDITVSRSVKNTFLAAGNEQAFKVPLDLSLSRVSLIGDAFF